MKRPTDTAWFERYKQEHTRSLGKAVRELRTNMGLTQSELARRAQVSVRWIQRLETNQLQTDYLIWMVDQVARALGVKLSDLYQRAEEMTGPPPWLKAKGPEDEQ